MFNLLFHTFDPRYIEVILHQSRYINHILPNHTLIDVDAIRDVIEDPDFITQDVRSQDVENYYRQEVMVEYPEYYVKVCVLFKPAHQGRVITAFVVDWPKPEEELIWQK